MSPVAGHWGGINGVIIEFPSNLFFCKDLWARTCIWKGWFPFKRKLGESLWQGLLKVFLVGWFSTLTFVVAVVVGGGDYMFTDSTIGFIISSYKRILFWEVIICLIPHVLPFQVLLIEWEQWPLHLLECFSFWNGHRRCVLCIEFRCTTKWIRSFDEFIPYHRGKNGSLVHSSYTLMLYLHNLNQSVGIAKAITPPSTWLQVG